MGNIQLHNIVLATNALISHIFMHTLAFRISMALVAALFLFLPATHFARLTTQNAFQARLCIGIAISTYLLPASSLFVLGVCIGNSLRSKSVVTEYTLISIIVLGIHPILMFLAYIALHLLWTHANQESKTIQILPLQGDSYRKVYNLIESISIPYHILPVYRKLSSNKSFFNVQNDTNILFLKPCSSARKSNLTSNITPRGIACNDIIKSLKLGLLSFSNVDDLLYSNLVAKQILYSFKGLKGMLSVLHNKRTSHSLLEDLASNKSVVPIKAKYTDSNKYNLNKKDEYSVRYFYNNINSCVEMSIYKDDIFNFNAGEISSALKEITSCSLFHELINLVNGIFTNVELLNDPSFGQRSECQRCAIMFIKVLTLRLRDIDDFTSISFNKFKLHITQFEVYALLLDFKGILNEFARLKNIDLTVSLSPTSPKIITSDLSRVLQVIVNCGYTMLECIEFGSMQIEASKHETNYINFTIKIITNEKKKVEALFNSIRVYQMLSNESSAIKNIEGLPLISTMYICRKIGKCLELKEFPRYYEVHVIVKDGFADQTFKERSFELDNIKSVRNSPRQLKRNSNKCSSTANCIKKYMTCDYTNKEAELLMHITDVNSVSSCDNLEIPEERQVEELKHAQIISYRSKNELNKLKIPSSAACHSLKKRRNHRRSSSKLMSQNISKFASIKGDEADYDAIIADDNYVNIMVLKRLLELVKVTSLCTKNGLECLNAVRQLVNKRQFHKIKIIFMDMQMPVMDGIEATMQISRLLSGIKAKRVPIIGISSDNNEEDRTKFMAAGISEFVRKPISRNEVARLCGKYMQ